MKFLLLASIHDEASQKALKGLFFSSATSERRMRTSLSSARSERRHKR